MAETSRRNRSSDAPKAGPTRLRSNLALLHAVRHILGTWARGPAARHAATPVPSLGASAPVAHREAEGIQDLATREHPHRRCVPGRRYEGVTEREREREIERGESNSSR